MVPLHDPAAVRACWDAPLGSKRTVTLRGTPGYGQPEVEIEATIGARHDHERGKRVRLDIGGFHVALCEGPPLPIHPSFWRELGLVPRRADLIVQKNFFHYRMFYATTSFKHIPVVSAGATSFERVLERDYSVPTHPQTKLDDWRRYDPLLRSPERVVTSAPITSADLAAASS